MIRYKNIPMKFDSEQFSSDIKREYYVAKSTGIVDNLHEWIILCLEMDVDRSTMSNWMNLTSREKWNTPYPNMTNFIYLCNALGLDPRKYFILDE